MMYHRAIELNKGQLDMKVKLINILFAPGLSFALCMRGVSFMRQLSFIIACSRSTEIQNGSSI